MQIVLSAMCRTQFRDATYCYLAQSLADEGQAARIMLTEFVDDLLENLGRESRKVPHEDCARCAGAGVRVQRGIRAEKWPPAGVLAIEKEADQ